MWEYRKHIKPYVESGYESEMEKSGWVWQGRAMTKEGFLYLWKRVIRKNRKPWN